MAMKQRNATVLFGVQLLMGTEAAAKVKLLDGNIANSSTAVAQRVTINVALLHHMLKEAAAPCLQDGCVRWTVEHRTLLTSSSTSTKHAASCCKWHASHTGKAGMLSTSNGGNEAM